LPSKQPYTLDFVLNQNKFGTGQARLVDGFSMGVVGSELFWSFPQEAIDKRYALYIIKMYEIH